MKNETSVCKKAYEEARARLAESEAQEAARCAYLRRERNRKDSAQRCNARRRQLLPQQ